MLFRSPLEIYVDGPSIILNKYQPACIFCGDSREITSFKGKNVCVSCLKDLGSK